MLEERYCPHCKAQLQPWVGPPETGWGEILVCNNNDCTFYIGSKTDIQHKDEDNSLGCRYAEDPDNGYTSFNLLAWHKVG
ncbi:hypothetical protein [Solidesulfovibrio sp.]